MDWEHALKPEHRQAVRRLDVEWAHDFNRAAIGHAFLPGPSRLTGKMYSADENALIALHKLRTVVGKKAQAKESKEWLRREGLLGVFEAPLYPN